MQLSLEADGIVTIRPPTRPQYFNRKNTDGLAGVKVFVNGGEAPLTVIQFVVSPVVKLLVWA